MVEATAPGMVKIKTARGPLDHQQLAFPCEPFKDAFTIVWRRPGEPEWRVQGREESEEAAVDRCWHGAKHLEWGFVFPFTAVDRERTVSIVDEIEHSDGLTLHEQRVENVDHVIGYGTWTVVGRKLDDSVTDETPWFVQSAGGPSEEWARGLMKGAASGFEWGFLKPDVRAVLVEAMDEPEPVHVLAAEALKAHELLDNANVPRTSPLKGTGEPVTLTLDERTMILLRRIADVSNAMEQLVLAVRGGTAGEMIREVVR
jgi:hypothetical protein